MSICIYVLIDSDGLHTVYGYITKMLTLDFIYIYIMYSYILCAAGLQS